MESYFHKLLSIDVHGKDGESTGYPHFTDEETEIEGNFLTCPRTHIKIGYPDSSSSLSSVLSHVLSTY